jgi:propionate CoA-transferase
MKRGQEVVYVTERAVFRLTPRGLVLSEVAPGIDVTRDVLDRMQFAPLVERDPVLMSSSHFNP